MSGKAPDWRAIDPAAIATTCSPRHVQSVLEDARRDILAAEDELRNVAKRYAALLRGVSMLLDSASPHMTHRNAKERQAYTLLRAELAAPIGDAS